MAAPTKEHEEQVARILEEFPTAKDRGLNQTLRDILLEREQKEARELGEDPPEKPSAWEYEFKNFWKPIPDAHMLSVDEETGLPVITCFEVYVTADLHKKKLFNYAMFWFYLDCEEIILRLIRRDTFGNSSEVDLCDCYYKLCLGSKTPS